MMKNRLTMLVVATVLGAWWLLPDPLLIGVDDIVAALGSAAALFKLASSYFQPEP